MTDKNRPLRAFLCHTSSDKHSVQKLYRRLVDDGIDAWLDQEKLVPGQNWELEIKRAVRNSDVVIVCLSAKSITKEGFVQKEIRFALDFAEEKPDGTIFIIPARLEVCDVPERMNGFQWVDLFQQSGYEKLKSALDARARSLGINSAEQNIFRDSLQQNLERLKDAFKKFNELDDQRERFTWVKHINVLLEIRRKNLRQLGDEITSEPLGTLDGQPVSSQSELGFRHGSTHGSLTSDDPDRIIYVNVKDGNVLCDACGKYGLGRIRVEDTATLCWDCAVEYQTKWRIKTGNRARIYPKVRTFVNWKQKNA